MQLLRDLYALEVTPLDPDNGGFSRVSIGDPPISALCEINKDGVEWKWEYEVNLLF